MIEGLDGSGKQTQAGLLRASLIERGADLRSVSFPDTVAPRRRWCACTWAGGSARPRRRERLRGLGLLRGGIARLLQGGLGRLYESGGTALADR
ncbi:MAG: hypothetical protein ACLR3C_00435 [Eggerthella lenta]